MELDTTTSDVIFTEPEVHLQKEDDERLVNEISIYDCPFVSLVYHSNFLLLQSPYPISLSRLDKRLDINRTEFLYEKTGLSDLSLHRLDGYRGHRIREYKNPYQNIDLMTSLSSSNRHPVVATEKDSIAKERYLSISKYLSHLHLSSSLRTDEEKEAYLEEKRRDWALAEKWFHIGSSEVNRQITEDLTKLISRKLVFYKEWRIYFKKPPTILNLHGEMRVLIDNRSFDTRSVMTNTVYGTKNLGPYEKATICGTYYPRVLHPSAQQITNAIDSSSPSSSPPSRHDYTLRSNEEEYSKRKEALEKKAKFVVITEENCTDFRIY
jgi:hypothetical protein